MGQAVFSGDTPRFLVTDPCIMDHCMERAERVDLFGHVAGLSDTGQIADNDCFRSGNGGMRFPSSLLVTSVQNYAMPLLNEELRGHSAEPIGGTCDENTRHYLLPPFADVVFSQP
jgi:hypothetical protein